MASPATIASALSQQEGDFEPAVIDTAAAWTTAAAEAECLEAKHTAAEDTAAARTTAAASTSRALDTQTASEAFNSTLMGIALLAYLQGSPAKHETTFGCGAGGGAGVGGGLAVTASTNAQPAGAHPYVPPRRYQRLSPVDASAPSEPLTRILAVIKATEPKPQYTCKRCVVKKKEGWREREKDSTLFSRCGKESVDEHIFSMGVCSSACESAARERKRERARGRGNENERTLHMELLRESKKERERKTSSYARKAFVMLVCARKLLC